MASILTNENYEGYRVFNAKTGMWDYFEAKIKVCVKIYRPFLDSEKYIRTETETFDYIKLQKMLGESNIPNTMRRTGTGKITEAEQMTEQRLGKFMSKRLGLDGEYAVLEYTDVEVGKRIGAEPWVPPFTAEGNWMKVYEISNGDPNGGNPIIYGADKMAEWKDNVLKSCLTNCFNGNVSKAACEYIYKELFGKYHKCE